MASNKKYWQSVEELKDSSIVETLSKNEFVEEIPTDEFLGDKQTLESSSTSRRDFLKYVGFTTAAASLAACEGPVRKSIPYVVKPDDITVGVADWYATTMADGYDFANILVKTREGRPILVMPNKEANGETNARTQASVLSLYDDALRLKEPKKGKATISWADADKEIIGKLNQLKEANEEVVLLTGTLASPSTEKIIADFIEVYPNVKHVSYDAVSESGALDAFEEMHGKRALPNYDLSKAEVIASIGADFLGDWHGGFEKSYVAGRKPELGKMSYHVQVESNMSLTGANADKRIVVKPSDQVFALINLYNAITGGVLPSKATPVDADIKKLATALKKAGSKAVVMTGLNDKNAQLVALAINKALDSEIIDTVNVNYTRKGNDTEVARLIADMKSGKVSGVITYNVNPIYTLADAAGFSEGLKKTKLSVALSLQNDDMANATQYALPTPHYLESWGDVMKTEGTYGLMQPTIKPLFNTRQLQDVLLKWSGSSVNYYDALKEYWKTNVLGGKSWNQALHDGFFTVENDVLEDVIESAIDLAPVGAQLAASAKIASGFELNLYTTTALGDGKQANNPWLQELPDPLTRATWDNYLTMSLSDARELGFENPVRDNGAIDGNYANVTVNGVTLKNVPVMIQPGQAKGSVGLALGYGRTQGLKKEMQVGVNAYPLYVNGNHIQYNVAIEKTSGWHEFACTQVQKTIAGRHDILKEATLKEVTNKNLDPKHTWNKPFMVSYDHQEVEAKKIDLWEEHNREIGHHFNLSIDLTSCTGCGACVIACHADNNVPVVGKNEVRVGRDMHWLRIDRYYSSTVEDRQHDKEQASMTMEQFKAENPNIANQDIERKYTERVLELSKGDLFDALENPAENPQVAFQPMMCQHCNHAPCETVCPVAATSHGRQGQNQMAYNRCVGTRYCANNCPYRVRRFNWFNYAENDEFDFNMNNEYGKMVLNPDVVVRSRGVMEKCSFCIQSTQEVILRAKREKRPVRKDEFNDACACSAACSSGSMVFGDINNPEDPVTPLVEDRRAFHVLDYIGTKPNVVYQVKVRNTNEA
ncbi:TAT-variant-translocated molybdopterin oxidoreductase [Tenacibaculum maritimum]|uniref:TAT-variant-translocated molybdopterin oxidoreductase n=1 Tax=Tenacibaculum maritimum TaxID=107401 RepID=UPI000421CBE1|nr:TAT-variant-translocated molybdopterin oxidoreductase [Tenacibaculum maritimum]MCD9611071.1 TAT-variant-translocated molybdopterin oxidoreductase [Tenacibaculum maritimum]QCD63203.1 quinol:cytochrome C oxidoreductase [Tenacibaculum maritimum]CAA0146770.1 Quinol:cytochrome c oxidoreductase iron-sulfur protein [Tenacibaculum maritimum]CAA0148088.1 Quinol:cytochrome c oxidoreductase iron-sulfur protein [Tenacibaculum maritimum]CAA0148148.1 Quinol:cytochrome c oxidoreductase iron-sulfur protein